MKLIYNTNLWWILEGEYPLEVEAPGSIEKTRGVPQWDTTTSRQKPSEFGTQSDPVMVPPL